MSAQPDTKEEILKLSKSLVQTKGFHSFSYQDISDKLKLKKASIHYHYPSKADLGKELLKSYSENFESWAAQLEKRKLTPKEKVEEFFRMFSKIPGKGDRICPGGAFGLDLDSLPKSLKLSYENFQDQKIQWLSKVLKEGRSDGSIRSYGTPLEQAECIYSTLQGSLQYVRSVHQTNKLNGIFNVLRKFNFS
ncbi:transcriptional regulator, TetR family [Leptospira fainei serovar Hurstbridge str. BUT 6]|uniref:Transcriptional regulator, TetR family n=1 Tax=Leptospira fainei serovar Hurstbridge str. BUT 6 TaxID=1193011 RepID=S3V369_9LEPT|nr:TetR/AcrR family transcriptional regulator [Leptospira fainei]EPG75873.1 transcriptional regulator, TetR family [Leptospira fainei serovar Hurstbridge str. BUT 6]